MTAAEGCEYRKVEGEGGWLDRKKLRLDVLKGFELERVAGGVEKEHGRLFAGLALESGVGLDDEFNTMPLHTLRQVRPLRRPQNHPTVRHRHAMPIDRIEMAGQLSGASQIWIQMTDELMTVEIEIDPIGRAAAFAAAEDILVEAACLLDVAHLYGDVEWRQWIVHG